jgi:hypothetical protein
MTAFAAMFSSNATLLTRYSSGVFLACFPLHRGPAA